jgi:hypothetical protein
MEFGLINAGRQRSVHQISHQHQGTQSIDFIWQAPTGNGQQ